MYSTASRDGIDLLRMIGRGERFRPYHRAHRQLRLALARCLQCFSGNAAGELEPLEIAGHIDATLALCAVLQAAETRCLHAPLREHAPRALLAFDSEHEEQFAAMVALQPLLAELRTHPADAAAVTGELELRLSQFTAETLAHMAEEEATLTRLLWLHFSDAQLREFTKPLHNLINKDMT